LILLWIVDIQPVNPLTKTFNQGVAKMEFAISLSNLRLSINKDPCGYPCGSRVGDDEGQASRKGREGRKGRKRHKMLTTDANGADEPQPKAETTNGH
jgi:hypothetical protein